SKLGELLLSERAAWLRCAISRPARNLPVDIRLPPDRARVLAQLWKRREQSVREARHIREPGLRRAPVIDRKQGRDRYGLDVRVDRHARELPRIDRRLPITSLQC